MSTVMIVDDEPTISRLTAMLLNIAGHQTVLAESGPQALAALEKSKPDLVMLDIFMPGMDGMQVLAQLKERGILDDLPVVMYTALSDDTKHAAAVTMGAKDFIVKGRGWDETYARLEPFLRDQASN